MLAPIKNPIHANYNQYSPIAHISLYSYHFKALIWFPLYVLMHMNA